MDSSATIGPENDDTRVVTDAVVDKALDVPVVEARSIGRYLVLSEAGSGGMGRVYRAYDPKLRREVALKLLKVGRANASDAARVQREAQAMAQLSHPNVVPVYDVEHAGDSVFIAMEYVAGKTLRAWGREGHAWREVLDVYEAAGRGLAAAHEAGIIHRDFKPANALLGDDGRVRVMDFGLARGTDVDVPSQDVVPPNWSGPDSSLSEPLTEVGMVMGTPAYMAPELVKGASADASTDQYSFCVALFEALYGSRPFRGRNLDKLRRAKEEKDIARPTASDVPTWLQRVVERGLAPDPGDRWPSMSALLEALAADPSVRRRRRQLAGAAAVVVIGAAFGGFYLYQQQTPACAGAEEKLRGVWGEPEREATAAAFAATDMPYATATFERVGKHLDAYAAAWIDGYVDACEATEVRKEQSAELLDARMRCLDGRRDLLGALVETLGEADPAVVEESIQAVGGLPSAQRCADKDYVTARVRPPDDAHVAAEVREQRRALSRARALGLAGRYEDARGLADEVSRAAADIDYVPLRVSAAVQAGMWRERTGEYGEAEALLRGAFFDARKTGQDELRLRAAIKLVIVVGERLARHAAGRTWADHARAEIEAVGREDDHVELLNGLGLVELAAGEAEQGLAYHSEALSRCEASLDAEHPCLAISVNNLAAAKYTLGDYEGATDGFKRALQIRLRALGPDHPDVATAYNNVATAVAPLGKLDEAEEAYVQALEILKRGVGEEHPLVATTIHNLGTVYLSRGEGEKAEKNFLRGLAIRRKALASDHPLIAISLSTLSAAQMALGKNEEAIEALMEALAIQTKSVGPEHPDLASTLNNLGNAYFAVENYDRSLEYHLRNITVREKALGPEHPKVAMSLANLARTLDALGRSGEAIPYLERARAIQDTVEGRPGVRGTIYQYLAEAMWKAGRRSEALKLSAAALELFAEAPGTDNEREGIERWLREHRGK